MQAEMPDLRRLLGDALGAIAGAVKLCEVCFESATR